MMYLPIDSNGKTVLLEKAISLVELSTFFLQYFSLNIPTYDSVYGLKKLK